MAYLAPDHSFGLEPRDRGATHFIFLQALASEQTLQRDGAPTARRERVARGSCLVVPSLDETF
jgi:hypothetical protein